MTGGLGVLALGDRWREMLQVFARRKLRTALTALAVAWGIFMLVVLLAIGNALARGTEAQFSNDAINSVFLSTGATSRPFRGLPKGVRVRLDNGDGQMIRESFGAHAARPLLDRLSGRFYPAGQILVRYHERDGAFPLRAVEPDHMLIEGTQLIAGRFINALDMAERRRVVVVGRRVVEALFPPGASALGADLQIGSFVFRIIGISDEPNEERERQVIFLPLSTAQMAFAGGTRVNELAFTIGDVPLEEGRARVASVRRALAARHGVAPDDDRALHVWNNQEMRAQLLALFAGIRGFVWTMGLGTVLAGVVGVSNIMLISVKERTREFGVRKAVGATPFAIVSMVVSEAMTITLVSGYLGLVAAVATVEGVRRYAPPTDFLLEPAVDLGVGLAATGVLVLAGVLAGAFPALRAARINPIAALRSE